MEPTQEEIQKTVSSLFDISKTEISLTKMKFRFRNIVFKENSVFPGPRRVLRFLGVYKEIMKDFNLVI